MTRPRAKNPAITEGETVPRVRPEIAILALGDIAGIEHATAVKLYDERNFASLFTASRDEVHWIAGNARVGTPHAFTGLFFEGRDAALERAHFEYSKYQALGLTLLLDTSPQYPPLLRALSDRPRWLFVRGNVELLSSERLITVVGTREPTADGSELAKRIGGMLVHNGFAIVAGLAEGIDSIVHREVVSRKGQTVAVLGTGIFSDFPSTTADLRGPIVNYGGAIVTEFFPKEQYSRQRFVQRNRIQAALSAMTIPIEARIPSGTMHTVRFANQYGRAILGVKWAGGPETPLHDLIRELGGSVTEVPLSDDPFMSALAQKYSYMSFARESELARKNAQIERVVRYARGVIKTEGLSAFEVDRMMKAIRSEEGD